MDTLLASLGAVGLGLTANPAPGDLTLGGVLAIGGHGTAIQANGETPLSGKTYGSVSNLVLSLTAVVWNPSTEPVRAAHVLPGTTRASSRCWSTSAGPSSPTSPSRPAPTSTSSA